MENHRMPSPRETAVLDTSELRASFLLEDLFNSGEINLIYTDLDRAIVGSAIPTSSKLELPNDDALKADFFCQRREMGILNIGSAGTVTVDGTTYPMREHDCLYIGRGSREISFTSESAVTPAVYYLVSYPAHAAHPDHQGQSRRCEPRGTRQQERVQRAHHFPIHPRKRHQELPARYGLHRIPTGKCLEYHALPYP